MGRLNDGFSSEISFSENPRVLLWEKEITPPGIDAGGANDTTTMRNARWRTRQPKKLLTLDDMELNVAYDPMLYDDIVDMAGVNQEITLTFSDGATLTFWGWVDKFKPSSLKEGEQPTASITIICSNENALGAETAPVAVAGS